MKQCPKCSVTYANDKQKFCTKDGTPLVDAQPSAPHDETVRIDSAQLDDEVTKFISGGLPPEASGVFDPYKTTVSTPQPPSPPAPSQPSAAPPVVNQPAPAASTEPKPSEPQPPATASGKFDPFKTTIAGSDEAAVPAASSQPPAPSQPPPALRQTIASPAPPPPAPPVSAPVTSTPEPPPSQPIQTPPASPPPVTSNTANINPQATSASIAADTVPAVAVPPSPPIAPSVPVAAAAAQPPAPAKRRSKLPLILGILFVLFVIGAGAAVAGYFFVAKPWLEKKRVAIVEPRPEPTPIVVSTPDVGNTKPEKPKIEVPPYSPPSDAVQFVNSSANLDGKLAEHYVDFSFYYPKTWQKDPKAGVPGASNFAKVERRLPPDFTQENFAVGWYASSGTAEGDQAVFPTLAQNLSKNFAKSFSDYKKVSEGPTKAGVYDGYEFRFESVSRNTEHGDIKIWGRVIFVPPTDGTNNGVTMLMLTTSLAQELRSVADVGEKGDLPMVLKSFRFGK